MNDSTIVLPNLFRTSIIETLDNWYDLVFNHPCVTCTIDAATTSKLHTISSSAFLNETFSEKGRTDATVSAKILQRRFFEDFLVGLVKESITKGEVYVVKESFADWVLSRPIETKCQCSDLAS